MSYVTGISGNVISAASAGYAPTNSAEVSAIASAYATGSEQVVTSLQYATSESATVASTVTADTAIGYGARDISADYYDYGYGPWTLYSSSTPLIKVRMTSDGNMRNYSSYPLYLYMVPYGATNQGSVSNTGNLTGARDYGYFSGDMNDFIVAEGTASALSQYPSYVEVTFNVTHVPFVGSDPAFWGTDTDVPGRYVVDSDVDSKPVFCVAGGYDGYELFELRSNTTAELDFGSIVTVSSVSGINQLGIVGGGADMSAVSAIASSYANGVSAAASSTVSVVSSNSSTWARNFSVNNVTYIDSIITGLKTGTGYYDSASAIMGVGSALQTTTGSGEGSDPGVDYPMGLYLHNGTVQLSTTDYYHQVYVRFMRGDGSFSVEGLHPTAYITDVSGDISAYSTDGAFTLDYTANSVESLAFQSDLTGAGVDSATVSAIASAYAESAASSKLDTTAFNSGDFYTTANESGYVDSAYVDSAVSGKADSSALSSYVPYSSLEYNTASAISGINGSALAAGSTYSAGEGIDITDDVISVETPVDIVAGPGIVIDNPDGNTLRVSVAQAEEVVLWDNYTFANNKAASVAMTETPFNFSQVRITFYIDANDASWGTMQTQLIDMAALASNANKDFTLNGTVVNGADLIVRASRCSFSGTSIVVSSSRQWYSGGGGAMTAALHVYRIVGVGRIANN